MNHTATHLINLALRETLGAHVEQKGSLVAPGKLRLDFTHDSRLSDGQVQRIEEVVNGWIQRGVEVHTGQVALADALKIPGLRAL